jgi:hypothetical protein
LLGFFPRHGGSVGASAMLPQSGGSFEVQGRFAESSLVKRLFPFIVLLTSLCGIIRLSHGRSDENQQGESEKKMTKDG